MYKRFVETRIGILGGGQLGRMLIQAGIDLNLNIAILDPDPDAPCRALTNRFSTGKLTDFDTVYRFGKVCDLITIEIENVNVAALKKLQREGKEVYPQPEIIRLIQDKVAQKLFYVEHDIPTAPYEIVNNASEVRAMKNWIPMVNKLAREGYDGRGVCVINTPEQLDEAFDAKGLIERFIDFEKEISVIVAQNQSGEIMSFPAVELVFHPEHNLVDYLFSPADITGDIATRAKETAERVIKTLGMTGLLAVEMFVTREGEVLVNEIAPRTHNSGHQTIEGNITSQFEQHWRSILNMPLGDTEVVIPTAMVNLLGAEGFNGVARYEGINEVLKIEGTHVHLYGKRDTRPFRKMGHVTITDRYPESLKAKVEFVKKTLKVIS